MPALTGCDGLDWSAHDPAWLTLARDLARQQGVPPKTPDLRWPKAATYYGGRLLL